HRKRGDGAALRRQYHPSYPGGDHLGDDQAWRRGQSGDRPTCALRCPADGKGPGMSFIEVTSPIQEIIEEARNGRMFILVDDEERENEGDLVIPAQMATPDAINFMARFGRGLICLALTRQRVEQLKLPLMSQQNASRLSTAFTVSIEAREGVTTGIS